MSDGATRICWRCQRETPVDREFCVHCHAYQNFEPTVVVPTVSRADPSPRVDVPPRASPDPAPPGEPPSNPEPDSHPAPEHPADTLVAPAAHARGRRARLACRPVDGEYTGDSVVIGVPAGGEGRVVVLVENNDDIVDTYDLSVVGLTGGWWSIEPSTVRLFPAAKVDRSRGDAARQEVEIVVRPPRSSEATARRWPARIVARSREHRDQAASDAFAVDVGPFHAFETEVAPTRTSGRRQGRLGVDVANTGNTPLGVGLSAKDPEGTLRCAFEPDRLTVPPGGRTTSFLTVRPPRPIVVGRAVERPFTVVADPGAAAPAQSKAVAFRHRPWIPRWVLTLVPLLLAAGLAAWLAFPRYATVPQLKGLTQSARPPAPRGPGLKLGTVTRVTLPNGKGLVIELGAAGRQARQEGRHGRHPHRDRHEAPPCAGRARAARACRRAAAASRRILHRRRRRRRRQARAHARGETGSTTERAAQARDTRDADRQARGRQHRQRGERQDGRRRAACTGRRGGGRSDRGPQRPRPAAGDRARDQQDGCFGQSGRDVTEARRRRVEWDCHVARLGGVSGDRIPARREHHHRARDGRRTGHAAPRRPCR